MIKFLVSSKKIFVLILVLFGSSIIVDHIASGAEPEQRQSAEWDKTVKAAEREGSLAIYGNLGYEKIFDDFEKKFPSIKVAYVTGRGSSDIVPRLLSEHRAGKYLGDIYLAGVNGMDVIYDAKALNPIKSALLLPEVVDTSKWWEGEHNYLDPEKQYVIVFNGPFRVDVVYNTKLADPKDFKSYWDLLNPKWVGKIEIFSNISAPHKFFYYHPDLGAKFLSRLFSEMQVTLSGSMTQIVDWLGTGKFALAIAPAQHTEIHKAQVQGLPVGLFKLEQFKEGVNMTSGTGTLGLLKGAPHPNAAKVAINWLLSREGQISFQKNFLNADSFRIDVPKGEIPPEFRRRSGIKYFDADRMEYDPKPIRDLMNKFGKRPAR